MSSNDSQAPLKSLTCEDPSKRDALPHGNRIRPAAPIGRSPDGTFSAKPAMDTMSPYSPPHGSPDPPYSSDIDRTICRRKATKGTLRADFDDNFQPAVLFGR
ncbi:hypothetical protein GCM10023191_061680 [Actinoallomurus oryzae]|uniref:Uncharacterized protein n=1 Tax=Actinoallomurus oryzae TaxID=502180 RepID=A0ABP8QLA2_9ACTN